MRKEQLLLDDKTRGLCRSLILPAARMAWISPTMIVGSRSLKSFPEPMFLQRKNHPRKVRFFTATCQPINLYCRIPSQVPPSVCPLISHGDLSFIENCVEKKKDAGKKKKRAK